jgi:hypothetical protein
VAAKGAHMKSSEPSPPSWAEAMLRSLLTPSDRESISGDLLEEYRASKHPLLGAIRANVWYVKQVVSVLWPLIRPSVLAMAGLALLSVTVTIPWNVRLVPAPGISLFGLSGVFVGRLPRLPPDSSDQDGADGGWGNEFCRIRRDVRVRRYQSPWLGHRCFVQALHCCHSLGVAGAGAELRCSVLGFVGGVIGTCGTPIDPLEVRVS